MNVIYCLRNKLNSAPSGRNSIRPCGAVVVALVVLGIGGRGAIVQGQEEQPARISAQEAKALKVQDADAPAAGAAATTQGAVSKPDAAAPTAQTHPNNPELWNTEQMMEDAVIQIARRYNLNKAQEEYTRLLLTNRVRAFLDVHETDIRELLRESIDLRMGLKPGSADAFQKWAERAAPIYQAAQKAILDGNEEWGAILDAAQKKQHEADLAAMHANFEQVGRMLDGWRSGQGPMAAAAAAQHKQPGPGGASGLGPGGAPVQGGRVSEPVQPIVQQQVEDTWLAYVNRFIRTYKLDERQAISARERIYKDVRDQATQYREKHKKEFAALEAERQSDKPKINPEQIQKRLAELEKPLGELFSTLDKRLKALPDGKQLVSANPAEVKQLEAMFNLLAGELQGPSPTKPQHDPKVGPKAAPGSKSTSTTGPAAGAAPKSGVSPAAKPQGSAQEDAGEHVKDPPPRTAEKAKPASPSDNA